MVAVEQRKRSSGKLKGVGNGHVATYMFETFINFRISKIKGFQERIVDHLATYILKPPGTFIFLRSRIFNKE